MKVLVLMAVVVASVGLLVSNLVVAQATPSASRSFSEASVAPGGDVVVVVVSITAAGHSAFGQVKETLPLGVTYVESSLDDDEVEEDGQSVTFSLLGKPSPTTFTYTVTASTEEREYSFGGVFSGVDTNFEAFSDIPVGGAPSITLDTVTEPDDTATTTDPVDTTTTTEPVDPSAPSASRSFSEASVAPGGDAVVVVVSITAAGHGSFGQVKETLPPGVTYVESSLDDDEVEEDGQSVTFSLLGTTAPTTFTYTVTASTEEREYSFGGVFSGVDSDFEPFSDIPVGGAPSVTVAEATPTPTPTATPEPTVAPDEPTTDADMVTNVRIGRVRETLITLSWDALEGASGYNVQWRSGRLDWSEGRQLETSSTAITLRRLKPSTEYSVRVSATDVGTWSEAVTASTVGPDDDTGSPFPTMTPTPTATPEAPPPTPIPPTTMIATSTAATLMSADGTVTLELPADARSEAYQVNFESVSGCAYAGAKADVTFTCVKALIFDAEDMLETDVAFDAAPTISFQLSAEQVKALGGEFLLTKLHEMGGLMIITRASDDAAWTALAGTTLTIDDETGGAVLAGWPSRVTSFTAVADQAAYDTIQEMYAHLLPRPMLAPPTGGPSIPGVALLALLLGSVALLSAGWILTARRSGA